MSKIHLKKTKNPKHTQRGQMLKTVSFFIIILSLIKFLAFGHFPFVYIKIAPINVSETNDKQTSYKTVRIESFTFVKRHRSRNLKTHVNTHDSKSGFLSNHGR